MRDKAEEDVARADAPLTRIPDGWQEPATILASADSRSKRRSSALRRRDRRSEDRPHLARKPPRRAGHAVEETTWHYTDAVVPALAREAVLDALPALRGDPGATRFAGHMLFGSALDRNTGRPILAAGLMAEIEGRAPQHAARNYSAVKFLERLKADVLPGLAWSEPIWSPYGRGRCRTLIDAGLPVDLLELTSAVLRTPLGSQGGVGFSSGRSFNPRAKAFLRSRASESAVIATVSAVSSDHVRPETLRVVGHMNGLAPHLFTSALQNVGSAYAAALAIPEAARQAYALRVLRAVEMQPQPFYAPSARGRTARAVATGTSILSLPREVRGVLTAPWVHLDLRAAQLAVAARDWNVPDVTRLLSGPEDVWRVLVGALGKEAGPVLAGTLGPDAFNEVKRVVKGFVYALVFGAGRHRLLRLGADEDDPAPSETVRRLVGLTSSMAASRLLAHPAIAAMLRARSGRLRALVDAGGAEDCLGHFVPCARRQDAPSALAQLAQAAELALMLPVLDLAEAEAARASAVGRAPEWKLALWCHDGVWIAPSNRTKASRHAEQVKRAVDTAAARRGYPTHIEVEL